MTYDRIRRLFILYLVLTFGVVMLAKTFNPQAQEKLVSSSVSNIPCPDPDEHGDPCGPMCPCTCCPSHGMSKYFIETEISRAFQPSAIIVNIQPDNLHPKAIPHRVFHPPRV